MKRLEQEMLARIAQNRNVRSFEDYEPSQVFLDRQAKWPEKYKIPRSTWWDYPNYYNQPMMPEFHVHFRTEAKSTLQAMYDSYRAFLDGDVKRRNQKMLLASRTFEGSMSVLQMHVAIEERRVFPSMQRAVKDVDMSFLYDDHQHLHEEEAALTESLSAITSSFEKCGDEGEAEKAAFSRLFERLFENALKFDTTFMNHLGEEEELVVPVALLHPLVI